MITPRRIGPFEREANALARRSKYDEDPAVRAERAAFLAREEERLAAIREADQRAKEVPAREVADLVTARMGSDLRVLMQTLDGRHREPLLSLLRTAAAQIR